MMFDPSFDVFLRLAVGTLAGCVIGFQRARSGKPAGIRTMGLVALASTLATVTAIPGGPLTSDPTAAGRVIQGLITGVGFVGAGVILHGRDQASVHGLTTAAAIWFTAVLGAAAGIGALFAVLVATAIGFALLSVPEGEGR